jgi:UDP-N-acetylmuramoyl-L-alanyl-D-glutamate--2,6-diaminopimelate ligase
MADTRKIVKKIIPMQLFRHIEPFGHLVEAVVANIWYGFPSRKMHIIGITGTNGKTTTTFLVHKMLHNAMFKVGMLSTVAYGAGDDINPQIEHITTAQAGKLQKRLRDFKRAGIQWVVLESSSHSLAQHRVWGVPFEIAIMTNVTNDHLDYHGTFDNYLEAKLRLFTLASKNGRKFGIVNADDPNAKKFIDSIPRSVTYGVEAGELKAQNINTSVDRSTFQVQGKEELYDICINIPGKFNISNALAAVAVGIELGLTKGQIERGIAALKDVEGRMTFVDEGQKFNVIIDFASTPDAFEKIFSSVRPIIKGNLIAVFGSAGRRDEAKRSVQGEIAGKYCDTVILTEEDDRDVDGNEILNQIADGSIKSGKKVNKNLFLIHDREKAIEFALNYAKDSKDMVILLGKGHEKTIERADGEHPWNETEITRKILQSIKRKINTNN